MKCVEALLLPAVHKCSALEEVSAGLNRLARNPIAVMPWPSFSCKPDVSFAIAHHHDCIFIKYFVRERALQVGHHKTNDPVYKDSCVEFFISFHNEQAYYNFEFNCIGTCLAGYGPNKHGRRLLPPDVLKQIRHLAVIKSASDTTAPFVDWELTLVLPVGVFVHHRVGSLKGLQCRSNFFKCADEAPEPHFLAWTEIRADAPDFHLPQFFGVLNFS